MDDSIGVIFVLAGNFVAHKVKTSGRSHFCSLITKEDDRLFGHIFLCEIARRNQYETDRS